MKHKPQKTPPVSIAEHWGRFVRQILPAGVSETQIEESRRVFYAGANAFQQILIAISDEHVSARQGLNVLAEIERELQDFAAMIGTPEEKKANAVDTFFAGSEVPESQGGKGHAG